MIDASSLNIVGIYDAFDGETGEEVRIAIIRDEDGKESAIDERLVDFSR